MTIAEFIATFFGGGLLIFIIQEYRKGGKIELDNWIVVLWYWGNEGINTFSYLEIEMQITNTSEYSKIYKSFSAEFFDGVGTHELRFDGYNVKPAIVIEAKKATNIKFKLRPVEAGFTFHAIDHLDSPTYFKLTLHNSKSLVDYKFFLDDMELIRLMPAAF